MKRIGLMAVCLLAMASTVFGQGVTSTPSVPSGTDLRSFGTIGSTSDVVSLPTNGMSTCLITVSGSPAWSMTLIVNGQNDAKTWIGPQSISTEPAPGSPVTSVTYSSSSQTFRFQCAGYSAVQVVASGYTSGTAIVWLHATMGSASGAVATPGPLPVGASTAANQTAPQATPGADASKGLAVQGVTGGKPVSVTPTATPAPSSLPLPTGASTAANQTAPQAAPGSDASAGLAVQGVTGGKPVSVNPPAAIAFTDDLATSSCAAGAWTQFATPNAGRHEVDAYTLGSSTFYIAWTATNSAPTGTPSSTTNSTPGAIPVSFGNQTNMQGAPSGYGWYYSPVAEPLTIKEF